MPGTSANGIGSVGTMPDHSMAFVRQTRSSRCRRDAPIGRCNVRPRSSSCRRGCGRRTSSRFRCVRRRRRCHSCDSSRLWWVADLSLLMQRSRPSHRARRVRRRRDRRRSSASTWNADRKSSRSKRSMPRLKRIRQSRMSWRSSSSSSRVSLVAGHIRHPDRRSALLRAGTAACCR